MVDKAVSERPLAFGQLGDSLGFLLRLAQLQRFDTFFADFGEMGLRPGELSVLLMLADNPGIRQGVLAQSLMIKRAHMAKMVRAFEESGLLHRTVPEDDKRAMELWLTEAGNRHVGRLRAPFEDHEATPIDGLSPDEATELKRLLRKLIGIPGSQTAA